MPTAQEYKAQGNDAFKARQFEEAVSLFTKAIDLEPTDHVLYSNRSGAWASMHKYEEALKDAEKCLELAPQWPKGYSRKGLALSNLGRHVEAIEAYQKGLELDPENPALKSGLAEVKSQATSHIQSSNFAMGVAMSLLKDPKFEQYIKEDPDYITKLAGIAQEIANKRDVQQLQLAMSIADSRIREGLAKLFGFEDQLEEMTGAKASAEKKKMEEAKVEKAEQETVTPEEAKANALKEEGNAHYKARRFEEALRCYKEAQEANPREILLINNEAAVYLEQGKYDECIKACEKALELKTEVRADFSKVAKVYNRLAVCYKRMGDLPKCIEMYKKSLMEDNDRKVRQALREVERELEEQIKKAYIDPAKAEEHREKGNAHFKNKEYPEAKLEYDEAIKRNPSDARLYSNRCAVYLQLLEYPSALRDADKATELDPNFAKGWSRKGTCHFRLKEYHKALSAYQRGLQVDPENMECRKGLNEVMAAIQSTQSSQNVDEEQVRRALSDPEIQRILGDPQFQMILQQLQQDPSRLKDYLGDQKVMEGVQKLVAAGVLRTA